MYRIYFHIEVNQCKERATERLEHFGTPCYLPEPHETDAEYCPTCQEQVSERHECEECRRIGCKHCMVWDDDVWGWLCGSLQDSECRETYRREAGYDEADEA
jgi:hypothetical protein